MEEDARGEATGEGDLQEPMVLTGDNSPGGEVENMRKE